MKIRNTLGWLLPLLLAAVTMPVSAQSNQDLTEVKIPCWNCGNPNTDHRRYRNVAIMACTYGAESGQIDHPCEARLESNIFWHRDAWVHVEVCSGIEDVNETFGCQRVSVRARFEPLVEVDIPFIDYEDGLFIGTVKDIVTNQTLPNGDTIENMYLPDMVIINTDGDHTPYPDDHPYNDNNGGEPVETPGDDDPGNDPGDNSGGSPGNNNNSGGSSGGGGGNCNDSHHNAIVP